MTDKSTDRPTETDDQSWFWSPEWQAGERETDEELAAGRYKDFATIEELIDDLFSDEEGE